jgi:hypothetical protein
MFTATSTQRWPTYSDVAEDYGIAGLQPTLVGAPYAGTGASVSAVTGAAG